MPDPSPEAGNPPGRTGGLERLIQDAGRRVRLPHDAPPEAHSLLSDLRARRLRVHYQPIVALPDRRLLGFEALARIEESDGSLRPPVDFVPLAEAYGLAPLLGLQVLVDAVRQLDLWRRLPWAAHLRVSVNVAAGQLGHPEFVGQVQAVLDLVDIPAASLLLELTEGAALRVDAPEVMSTLDRIAALGVGWALDDFGTGFATLDNVKHLPVRVLKLDRGFIEGIDDGRQADEAIVRAVIGLADSLGLLVVAEGVETERQARLLGLWGCSSAQGWLFGRAEPAGQAYARVEATSDEPSITPLSLSWTSQSRATAIGLARVLATMDADGGHRRALVATVASALARQLGLAPREVDDVVSLALVHDAASLHLEVAGGGDGRRLWDAVPGLSTLHLPPTDEESLECQLVRAGLATAERVAAGVGPHDRAPTSPTVLRTALRACQQVLSPSLRPALEGLAERTDELRMPDVQDHLSALSGRSADTLAVEGRLRALASLSAALSSQDRFLGVVELTAEEARRSLGAASVSISALDADSGLIRVLVNVGDLGPDEERFPTGEVFRLDDFPVAARMMRSGMPHLQRVDDPGSDPAERDLLISLGKGSCAAVPLMVGDRLWGELYATTSRDMPPFTARHLELLTGVATVIAPALSHAQVQERTAELALQDPLTGLPNRRALDRAMFTAMGPEAVGKRCAVVVVDLNGLKQVNDDYGHAVGDRVLIGVAESLRDVLAAAGAAAGATAARLGGDEFALVLPGLRAAAARALLDELAMRLRAAPPPQVTLSAGVAEGVAGSVDPAVLFASADRAQYAAKRAGVMVRDAGDLLGEPGTRGGPSYGGPRARSAAERRPGLDQLRALAELAPGTSTADRLLAVGEVLGPWLDLSRVVISAVADGRARTVRTSLRRARPQLARRPPEEETYPLVDFPVTAAAIRDGELFVVEVGDPAADPGEVSVLVELGLTSVLGVGVPAEGGWLLELYGDEQSAPLRPAAPVLRAAVVLAGLGTVPS